MREQGAKDIEVGRVYVYSLLVPFPLGFIGTLLIAQPLDSGHGTLLALGVGLAAQVAAITITLRLSSKRRKSPDRGSLGP